MPEMVRWSFSFGYGRAPFLWKGSHWVFLVRVVYSVLLRLTQNFFTAHPWISLFSAYRVRVPHCSMQQFVPDVNFKWVSFLSTMKFSGDSLCHWWILFEIAPRENIPHSWCQNLLFCSIVGSASRMGVFCSWCVLFTPRGIVALFVC